VPVTENIEIVVFHRFLLFAPDQQEFLVITEVLFSILAVADPAPFAPESSYLHAKIWVNAGKQPLTYPAREKFLQQLIGMFTGSQPIAMPQEEALVSHNQYNGLAMDRDTQFGREVVKHPHVVIAGEERYFDTSIPKFSQLTLQADIAPGNGMSVLKPKIKDVTEQVDSRSIVADMFQPCYNVAFTIET
jgi:hypothetical protein